MANTQGMSDEFVESLMSTSSRSSSAAAAARQRKRLEERMAMPLPQGGPSARIVRASPQQQNQRSDFQEEEMEDQSSQDHEPAPPPIVGNIVERSLTVQHKNRLHAKPKTSRFAQSLSVNGFPSVHAPLGTFCQTKSKQPPKQPLKQPEAAKAAHKNRDHTITTESLLEASRRDASAMLQGMSRDDIKEQQQELKAALSPETINFLKQRAKQKSDFKGSSISSEVPTSQPSASSATTAIRLPRRNTQQEKERIAELMSSVRTHQDLDQAYNEYMKEPHPLEPDNATNVDESDNFALACDLLRSTNPRQTIWAARVVQHHLSNHLHNHQQVRDWPLLLPVSLRCLLDQPISANSGYILHTYALQSIHALLLLTAHTDHIVQVLPHKDNVTPGWIYADCYLDDAIPTPKLDTAYSATPLKPLAPTDDSNQNSNETGPAVAYATQSSSTSAQTDGEAFDRDPMWTLLSKMKIVPRIAQLITNTSTTFDWPPEAWMAMIGILCMIAQRSPGAASAIAHHKEILPRITTRVIPCLQDQDDPDESMYYIVYATCRLFGTLARQSRTTAQILPLVDLLPPLLARMPNNDLVYQSQKLGIYLWRTVLRYGLGLEALESMMAAAASHIALPYTHQYSLSTEFVSALTQVLECAKLAKQKDSALYTEWKNSQQQLTVLSILGMSGAYLASTQRSMMLRPVATVEPSSIQRRDESLRHRWHGARMRFLTNYWNLAELNDEANFGTSQQDWKSEDWSMEEVLTCLEAMDEWTDSSSLVELAWARLAKYATSIDYDCGVMDAVDEACEASASAFLDAFVQLLLSLSLSSRTKGNRMVQELARSVARNFVNRILEGLRRKSSQSAIPFTTPRTSAAQRGWINQAHFAIAKLFSHYFVIGELLSPTDFYLVRMMVFHLLGRIECGHEAMAAVLFSQDRWFQAKGNDLQTSSVAVDAESSHSPISSMFLGELCGSEAARKQLDHSFKLQHGFGITQKELGAFSIDSLLSEADQPRSGQSTDLTLPLGKLWLWQTLSGQIRTKDEGTTTQGIHEAANVVSTVLGLLVELEEGEELLRERNHGLQDSAQIPVGAKLYYLMNVCLNTEAILREDRILILAEELLARYLPKLNSSLSTVEFAQACLQHTDPSKKTSDDELDDKDKQLLALFQPETPNEISLSSEEMRSLEAFCDDMTEAYNDYGAQYEFFTKSMRLFLLPIFPSSIRCRALRGLRGIHHLLTLPSELANMQELHDLLCLSLTSGKCDTALIRDPPDFLDAITMANTPQIAPRPLSGYMLALSVAVLARNALLTLQSGEGWDGMKKRLIQLDHNMIDLIVTTMSAMREGTTTTEQMVDAALQSILASNETKESFGTPISAVQLDQLLAPYFK